MRTKVKRLRSRREDRIDAIVAAAQQVFLEQGYEAASLDAVARQANASKATIYAHFGSKMGLFEAIAADLIRQAHMPLQDPQRPVAEALTAFGEAFLGLMLSPTPLAFYRVIVSKGIDMPELARLWYNQGPRKMIAGLAAFFAARVASGELEVDDPETAAELFLMGLRGTLHMQAVTGLIRPPFDTAIRAKVKAGVALFMRAYGRTPRRPRS